MTEPDDRPAEDPVSDVTRAAPAVSPKRARRAGKPKRKFDVNVTGSDNLLHYGKNARVSGLINGSRNRIEVSDSVGETFNLRVEIHGNDNLIRIGPRAAIRGLTVFVGNHIPAHSTRLEIGADFSISRGGVFYLFNSGNALTFGDDCLLSYNTIVRCGESPHLIFDRETGAYLDIAEPVAIGNHVWIGEDVYITKRVAIPDHTIVAARSVVTKRFEDSFCAIGGNPARVIRRGVEWVRNPGLLVPETAQHTSYHARQNVFGHGPTDDPPPVDPPPVNPPPVGLPQQDGPDR